MYTVKAGETPSENFNKYGNIKLLRIIKFTVNITSSPFQEKGREMIRMLCNKVMLRNKVMLAKQLTSNTNTHLDDFDVFLENPLGYKLTIHKSNTIGNVIKELHKDSEGYIAS